MLNRVTRFSRYKLYFQVTFTPYSCSVIFGKQTLTCYCQGALVLFGIYLSTNLHSKTLETNQSIVIVFPKKPAADRLVWKPHFPFLYKFSCVTGFSGHTRACWDISQFLPVLNWDTVTCVSLHTSLTKIRRTRIEHHASLKPWRNWAQVTQKPIAFL